MTRPTDRGYQRWLRNSNQALQSAYPHLMGALSPNRRRPSPDANPSFVRLGYDAEGEGVLLDTATRLQHLQAIGMTRSGKSKFLEYLIRQDLLKEHGFILMDPHGGHRDSLFHETLDFIRQHRPSLFAAGKVFILSPNAEGQVVGFNPLAKLPGVELSVIADTLLSAFEQAWGGEDTHQKPLIRSVLKATFTALAERGMNLTDAKLLYDHGDRFGIRASIIEQLQSEFPRDELSRLHDLSLDPSLRREFQLNVLGPINRLNEFVSNQALARMFGMNAGFEPSPAKCIDILDIMEQGHILLVDLQPAMKMSEADAKLLGTIFLRYTSFLSKLRTHYKPFFVHVDECHLYMTDDIPEMLPQLAKYGVGLTLAHQWLSQLGKPDEKIYDAVTKSTATKVIFRLADQKEAETLAYAAMPLNLLEPKDTRPTATGVEVVTLIGGGSSTATSLSRATTKSNTIARARSVGVTESWSDSEATSSSDTSSHGLSSGLAEGASSGSSFSDGQGTALSLQYDPATGSVLSSDLPIGQGVTTSDTSALGSFSTASFAESSLESESLAHTDSTSLASTRGGGVSRAHSEAEGEGFARSEGESASSASSNNWRQAHKPIFETLPHSYFSKDEQLYKAGRELRRLPTAHAVVSIQGAMHLIIVPNLSKT